MSNNHIELRCPHCDQTYVAKIGNNPLVRDGLTITPLRTARPQATVDDAEVARRLIESWGDLQRGYDDIDWRDKLAEIIPELATAISTAHANGVKQGAEAERNRIDLVEEK